MTLQKDVLIVYLCIKVCVTERLSCSLVLTNLALSTGGACLPTCFAISLIDRMLNIAARIVQVYRYEYLSTFCDVEKPWENIK